MCSSALRIFAAHPFRIRGIAAMTKKTQTTAQGEEIPVPKRGDFFGNLKKAATPEKSSVRRPAKKR
jgi:hypothetical protein